MALSIDDIKRLSAELDEVMSLPQSDWHTWMQSKAEGNDPVHARLQSLVESGKLQEQLSNSSPDLIWGTLPFNANYVNNKNASHVSAGKHIGPYLLVERISEGGMGSVWLAERADGAYRRKVALKLPYAGPNAKALAQRFAVERDILALLEHRNIARLYDAGFAGETPFIALELIDGIAITQYCDERNATRAERLQLFRQVLRAVQYAHSHLVIHRDIKPSNVLVTKSGDVKLLDFGIAQLLTDDAARSAAKTEPNAKAQSEPENDAATAADFISAAQPIASAVIDDPSELTRVHGEVMTPRYASPEQLFGERVSTASDIYSLGLLLYRLLTQKTLYDTESKAPREEYAAIKAQAQQADFSTQLRARTDGEALPSELIAVLQKALHRAPNDRYQSAAEFELDLGRYLTRFPVHAAAATPARSVRLFLRRNWLASTAVLASFAAVSAFAGYIYKESEVQRRTKDFLLQALTPTSYYNDGGKLLTHAEMLNRAAAGVGTKFADQPKVQADLYQAIGESLFNLGEHEAAFQLRTRAQPIVDAAYGRTSREAIRNANRAAYMHLTQRRLPEFQRNLEDLLARCPSIQTVAEDKCFGTIWLQTQYFAYSGEGAKRKALWDRYDAAIAPTVAKDSRWHTLANYWGASAARQTGDMVAAKARWNKLLALKSTHDGAKGDHMTALSALTLLRASGFSAQVAPLARDLYAQGERYMGEAFDPRLFYIPGVSEAQAVSEMDFGAEAILRKGIARIEADAATRANPSVLRESADARSALALLLISKKRFSEAVEPIDTAIKLQSSYGIAHDQNLLEMQLLQLALRQLQSPLRSADELAADVSLLKTWRAKAIAHEDAASLPRIDALLSLLDPAESEAHWQRAITAMLATHARPPEIAVLLRAFDSKKQLPPPIEDATTDALLAFAKKVLERTEAELARRKN